MPDGAECRTAPNAEGRDMPENALRRFAVYPLSGIRAAWHSRRLAFAPSGIRAVWHSAPSGIPRRLASRAVWHLAPSGISRRGRIGVQVTSLGAASDRLERSANGFGAQVTRATVEERERAEYFIRVPPERLDALMDSVAALGDVESRSVGVEDVTERVIDAEARLNSLRASRDRLRQLLERAGTVQDVIAVERELARVQGEIQSLEARLTALRSQVALSEL